jgi:sporulation related protein
MADDPRAYRSNDPAARPAPASSSDPLAELARLIGQTDPFGEYGRQSNKPAAPAAAPPPAAPNLRAADYRRETAPSEPAAPAPRQAYAPQPQPAHAPEDDYYHPDHETADYPAPAAYGNDAGYRGQPVPAHDEHEDLYDDAPPPRRRIGILAVAAVFVLLVLGGAGALGYRALFGTSGSNAPPPVIKADTAPSKVVPASTAKAPNKLIYDRVADRGQDEKLVSREERPLDMKDQAPAPALALEQDNAPSAAAPAPANVVINEPKKVRTIAIRPDGTGDSQPVPANATAATPPAPARAAPPLAPARQAAPQQVANNADDDATLPAPRAAAPARSRNAPLSLSPDANNDAAPAPAPRAPTRTAAVAPAATPPAARAGSASSVPAGSYVQLSSQRSEAEAQAAFRSLQGKYPNQLGSRQAVIRKVELGEKGTYYRAMVGPLVGNEASELCSGLKAAGGQCLIQRN